MERSRLGSLDVVERWLHGMELRFQVAYMGFGEDGILRGRLDVLSVII